MLHDIRALAGQVPDATVTMTPIAAVPSEVDSSGLWIEPASRVVVPDGRPVQPTRRKFDLLLFLCEHPAGCSPATSCSAGCGWVGGSRTVDVHLRRLRLKLGQYGAVVRIVHGTGYRLEGDLDVPFGQPPE